MELSTSDNSRVSASSSPSSGDFRSWETPSGLIIQEQDDEQYPFTVQSSTDGSSERTFFTDEDGDDRVHVVIVGGDIGALSAALALAHVQNVKVTLVNVGIGFETSTFLGTKCEKRGLQLCTQAVSLLKSLGFYAKRAAGVHTSRSSPEYPGAIVKGFCLRRCKSLFCILCYKATKRRLWLELIDHVDIDKDGAILTRQSYKALPPTRGDTVEVPCMTIDVRRANTIAEYVI